MNQSHGGPESSRPARSYRVVDVAEIPGVPCPCGTARRAFADAPEFPGTIHVTEIEADARLHHHRTWGVSSIGTANWNRPPAVAPYCRQRRVIPFAARV